MQSRGAEHWDVVVVGGGPAGAACAAAARAADPTARVLVLDRADFPRDKVCGDGIAPEALDVLAGLGIDAAALTSGLPAVPRLRLRSPGGISVERTMHRPASVVPRAVFDDRLLTAALASGAELRRHVVRRVTVRPEHVEVDSSFTAGVVVGADGAESVVRRALGIGPNRDDRLAVAIRGYASEPPGTAGVQVILTTEQRWPAYAWSFPLGDGRANVGYGELVSGGVTGEGLLYAVLSGALAGAAAVHGADAGAVFRRALQLRLGRHLRHSSTASWASRWPILMDAVFRAAAEDQRVFDDVVELGLADGRLTARTLTAAARRLR